MYCSLIKGVGLRTGRRNNPIRKNKRSKMIVALKKSRRKNRRRHSVNDSVTKRSIPDNVVVPKYEPQRYRDPDLMTKHRSDCIRRFFKKFQRMEPAAQLKFWTAMINSHPFSLTQLGALRTAIDDRIRFDIVSCVPYEIALYIMSFLSPQDLCRAALTCRSWRTVCEDNRLWREKCAEEGLLDNIHTIETLFKKRISVSHSIQENFVKQSLPDLPHFEWRLAYLKHISILRNWRNRRFEISEPFISPNPIINEASPDDEAGDTIDNGNSGESARYAPHARDMPRPARRQCTTGASGSREPSAPTHKIGMNHVGDLAHHDHTYTTDCSDRKNESLDSLDRCGSVHEPDMDRSDRSELPHREGCHKAAHLMQLRCHEDSVITCLQFNPRTNTIVSGSDDQTLKVWSSETGRCITTLEGHTGGVWSSQLSSDDIVISGSTDRTLRVWKARTGELIHTLYGHTSTVRCLALQDKYVVSGSRDTTLRLWSIEDGNCIHVFTGHSAAVRCVEYKNDTIVSGAYDYLVMVWDATTGTCKHALERHYSRIYSLQFDGRTIASGSLDSNICIWDAVAGKLRHHLEGHQSLTSKMQLKGNLLVSANADSYCKVWNIETGECIHTLGGEHKHTSAITSVYFNNRFVVTSSDDGTVKLWDIRTGNYVRDLVVLPTASKGGVVWRIRASHSKLICAVGSRTQTEDTHLLVLNFDE